MNQSTSSRLGIGGMTLDMIKQRDQNALFMPNANQSNVFKELIPNPTQREGVKRSIEMHLEDILCNCSLRDIYDIKDVYSRNNYCSITGALLEVKPLDVAANFMVSNRLRPNKLQKGQLNSINSNLDDDDKED